jgi:cytochrome c oxidase cbb3-type subunit III
MIKQTQPNYPIMRFIKNNTWWKAVMIVFLIQTVSTIVYAQTKEVANTAPATPKAFHPGNYTLYILFGVMIALGLLIFYLSKVLLSLGRKVVEKHRSSQEGKTLTLLFIGVVLLPAQQLMAQAADEVKASVNGPFILSEENIFFYMILAVLIVELIGIVYFISNIVRFLRMLEVLPEPKRKEVVATESSFRWGKWWDKVNASVSMDREKDVMTDHEYDGIRELDNNLPPWWKYGFIATIIFAAIYLFNHHITHASPSSLEEYQSEMTTAQEKVNAFMATQLNRVDENNLQLAGASGLEKGKNIFAKNCVSCHNANGEGNAVGPNLTDDYWLHGNTLASIYTTIKNGVNGTAMKSWQTDFSAGDMRDVASYIKAVLHGSKPANPKPPQGILMTEQPVNDSLKAPAAKGTDSVKVKDSMK